MYTEVGENRSGFIRMYDGLDCLGLLVGAASGFWNIILELTPSFLFVHLKTSLSFLFASRSYLNIVFASHPNSITHTSQWQPYAEHHINSRDSIPAPQ